MTTPFSVFFELPCFYYTPQLLKHIGTNWMLILAHAVLLIRLLIYMYVPILFPEFLARGGNWTILVVELLHGLSFGLYWSAGINHVQKIAPKAYLQTFIGIYSTLSNNAGGIFGTIIGGSIYDIYGYFYMWGLCFVLMVLSCFLFCISISLEEKSVAES
jgi:MFS family permease